MKLSAKLDEIRFAFENGDTPNHIVQVLNDHVDRLVDSKVKQNALQLGDLAPLDVEVYSDHAAITLAEIKQDAPLVLSWFRGNW
ncbi:MAG: hypothetical protein AAF939_21405 [Planctomycetota bacterium]